MAVVRNEAEVAHKVKAVSAKCVDVFQPGIPTYLRYNWGVLAQMAPVKSHGVVNPGCLLSVHWQDKVANPHVPENDTEVTCHALNGGILYVARGRVQNVGDGPQPRLRIQLDPLCVAMPLRKYERFEALARLALVDEDQAVILEYRTPQKINISQGGFGLTARPLGLKPGKMLGFNLEIQPLEPAQGDEAEVLVLSGMAVVRMFAELKDTSTIYIGLQFDNLPETDTLQIEDWLTRHQSGLRPC